METLNVLQAEEFLRLCRGGRLYDVERWISAGKSLVMPSGTRGTPLAIAIDNGFHSLAELLAHNESQEQKDGALRHAVQKRRWEYVQLLMEHGGNLKSVPLIDALRSWDPRIIRFFLDNGADAVTGSPFALAFDERIQRALRPFVDYKAEHRESATQLQEQVDAALRSACSKSDLKWVSLLMWAGADPRSLGPPVDGDGTNAEDFTTAMHEAAYAENVKVLKRLKPDPTKDDIPLMLRAASLFSRLDTIGYLLDDLAANPNDKPNGGSTALDRCLTSFASTALMERTRYERVGLPHKASKYSVSKCLDTMRLLLDHGAIWRPDDIAAVGEVRRNLYDCDAEVTLEVVSALVKQNACGRESLDALLKTGTMKRHVVDVQGKLARLGFDARTPEQKAQEARQKEEWRKMGLAIVDVPLRSREDLWRDMVRTHGNGSEALQSVGRWLGKGLPETQYSQTGSGILGEESRGEAGTPAPPIAIADLKHEATAHGGDVSPRWKVPAPPGVALLISAPDSFRACEPCVINLPPTSPIAHCPKNLLGNGVAGNGKHGSYCANRPRPLNNSLLDTSCEG